MHRRPETGTPPIIGAGEPDALARAFDVLAAGGIVGVPTETVYGLAVLPQAKALEALLAAKGRADDKGIALLLDSTGQATALAEVSQGAARLMDRFWPGALTLVLPVRAGSDLPTLLTGHSGMVGLRMPDHEVPRALARILGPIAVSSANVSGRAPALTAAELVEAMGGSVGLVLDDGPVRGGVASTVVELGADGSLRILREGAIPAIDIERPAAGGDRPA